MWLDSLCATIGSSRSRRASSVVIGAQTMPEVWRMMNAIFSARAERGRDDQIALALAVVIVGDDDEFALGKGLQNFLGWYRPFFHHLAMYSQLH